MSGLNVQAGAWKIVGKSLFSQTVVSLNALGFCAGFQAFYSIGPAKSAKKRSKYAQHSFLAHMDLRLGSALSGIHEGGNVVEDVRFFGGRYGIWTPKPSPGWQFTVIDCSFEGQLETAILEREAGLTLIRPRFQRVPSAVMLEPGKADELWIKDARLEEVSGPAFVFGVEKNPRNQINLEGIACRSVPLFASLRESGKRFKGPGEQYVVKTFSHGLNYQSIGAKAEIKTVFDAVRVPALPAPVVSDLSGLPPLSTFTSVCESGAKGDGVTDDTEAFQKAILEHRSLYIPTGFMFSATHSSCVPTRSCSGCIRARHN